MNWFIKKLFGEGRSETINNGTRIMTPHGMGTVRECLVTVDLDAGSKLRPSKDGPRVNATHPVASLKQPV